ncbi:thiamine-phosphate kinase [Porticoccaceae bacterium]|nr:thiamine-phosphate kinase [Porticoccaceae bacterium]
MSSEFALIADYFSSWAPRSDSELGVELGIGDDAALLDITPGQQLVAATDTLVEGIHFPHNYDPFAIATRTVGVNLSDLAAMGATPRWVTLALTLPAELANDDWLRPFSRGLKQALSAHNVALVGGDTSRGPLTLTLTVMGEVTAGSSLCRHNAQPGDRIFVSGSLGDGAAALALIENRWSADEPLQEYLLARYNAPQPAIELGSALAAVANSAIDLSDGLLADLGHLCRASGVSASIDSRQIPLADGMLRNAQSLEWALRGGDDYRLCFTVPAALHNAVPIECTDVGEIVALSSEPSLCVTDLNGDRQETLLSELRGGYDHFAG